MIGAARVRSGRLRGATVLGCVWPSPLLAAVKAPSVFSDQVLHRVELDRLRRDDALHLRVFNLELLQANDVAELHAGVLGPPQPDGVSVDAVATAELLG